MLSNMRLCSNVPAQSIIQTALGGYQSVEEYLQPGGRIYEQREVIYKLLNDIPGVSAKKPKAAFYIFPKLDVEKFNIYDDEKFALDLLREKENPDRAWWRIQLGTAGSFPCGISAESCRS